MNNYPLPRLDKDDKLKKMFEPYCRFKQGDIWIDPSGRHKIGCMDACDKNAVSLLMNENKAALAIHDPPYNLVAFNETDVHDFIMWSKKWIEITSLCLKDDAALYVWLGADQNNHFQPFAEFILMMKETDFASRSFITMRNQRGYGTQKNWMAVRQELLYYTKGKPDFNVDAEYTDIPKVMNGYYKKVNGEVTSNFERSKSSFIRAGNVWVDIQQIFYRMEENINGCYAQKPLKSIERILLAGSKENDLVIDFFSHAGTTLLSSEIHRRNCFTTDIEPIYCEITLRRLERYRQTGHKGWQNSNPFIEEIFKDKEILPYLKEKYNIVYPERDDVLFD